MEARAPVSLRRILSAVVPDRSGAEDPCAPGSLLASAERAGSKTDAARDASDDECSRQLARLSLLQQSHWKKANRFISLMPHHHFVQGYHGCIACGACGACVSALYTNHTPPHTNHRKRKVRPKRGKVKQNKKQIESRPHPEPELSRKQAKKKKKKNCQVVEG